MAHASYPGTAFITGASTGIGALYAEKLAQRGHDLILAARSRERLSALASSISTRTGRAVQVLSADLNDRAELARVEELLRADASITLLVNNADIWHRRAGAGGAARRYGHRLLGHRGLPVESLDARIVMRAEGLVDAALLGFERGEKITIPSLHDGGKWDAYESARLAMAGQLSSSSVAPRYA